MAFFGSSTYCCASQYSPRYFTFDRFLLRHIHLPFSLYVSSAQGWSWSRLSLYCPHRRSVKRTNDQSHGPIEMPRDEMNRRLAHNNHHDHCQGTRWATKYILTSHSSNFEELRKLVSFVVRPCCRTNRFMAQGDFLPISLCIAHPFCVTTHVPSPSINLSSGAGVRESRAIVATSSITSSSSSNRLTNKVLLRSSNSTLQLNHTRSTFCSSFFPFKGETKVPDYILGIIFVFQLFQPPRSRIRTFLLIVIVNLASVQTFSSHICLQLFPLWILIPHSPIQIGGGFIWQRMSMY